MLRQEFMDTMRKRLSALGKSPQEITEILADFEEHIATGVAGGRTEEDVVAGIGDPVELAAQYADGTEAPKSGPDGATSPSPIPPPAPEPSVTVGGVGRGFLAALGLLFIDLILAIPILASLFAVVVSLWAVALSIAAVGVALIIAALPVTVVGFSLFPLTTIPGIFLALIGISLLAFAILFGIGMYYVSKYFFLGVKAFFGAQVKIVKGGSRS
jgi:uncharacterized membrane protein